MSEPLLNLRNLVKTYPNGTKALRGVSFEVQRGEFLVIIGLSGSGKSTLFRCLNRLLDVTSGEIFFAGTDVTKLDGEPLRRVQRRIGMIFQQFNLIPRHSVLSNVLMGALGQTSFWKSFLGLWSKEEKSKAENYLKLVGLLDKSRIRADQLSGGQQQRVAIARALMQQPELLLADEPVASLDPAVAHTVMDYLRRANQELGITVIANLHFLSLVREYATRVIALKAGEVVYEGTPEKIDEAWFARIYGEDAKEVQIQ